MGAKIDDQSQKFGNQSQKKDWQFILACIGAKRTHEPAFQQLFERVLSSDHDYSRQARTLAALYDFTPIRSAEDDGV